jgi:hypothetical protein
MRIFAVPGAHDGLFHEVGGVFGNREPRLRRGQQGDPAGLTELEGGGRILVDEGRLGGRFLRQELRDDPSKPRMDRRQPRRQSLFVVGFDPAAA